MKAQAAGGSLSTRFVVTSKGLARRFKHLTGISRGVVWIFFCEIPKGTVICQRQIIIFLTKPLCKIEYGSKRVCDPGGYEFALHVAVMWSACYQRRDEQLCYVNVR